MPAVISHKQHLLFKILSSLEGKFIFYLSLCTFFGNIVLY